MAESIYESIVEHPGVKRLIESRRVHAFDADLKGVAALQHLVAVEAK